MGVVLITTPDTKLTTEQIQGRLNQREIPWLASPANADDLAVKFTPKYGRAIYVFWDRGHSSAPTFEAIVEFLAADPN